jgi:branched-chain amino acid transport system substrate-binding protein
MKSMKSKVLIGIGLAITVALAVAFLLRSHRSNENDNPLTIGVILPLTGDAASYGVDCRRGIEMEVANIRKQQGRAISVEFEDSKADPATAVAAFNKLVNVDHAKAVIGDMFSSTTLAIAPLAQQAHVLLLTPTAADERIPATGDFIYSIYPPAKSEGDFMAQKLSQASLGRVVVLYQNQVATKTIAEAFALAVSKRSGNVVLQESIPSETSSYRSLLTKVATVDPTTIYISAYRDPVAMLIAMGKEMGINAQWATQSTLYDAKALADYPGKLNCVLVSGPYFDTQNATEAISEFTNDYRFRYGGPPSVWSAYGYDAADILIHAILKAEQDKTSPTAELSGHEFTGLTGQTEIRTDRSVVKEMVLYRVVDNKFVKE